MRAQPSSIVVLSKRYPWHGKSPSPALNHVPRNFGIPGESEFSNFGIIGRDPLRCEALLLQQLAQQSTGRLGAAPGLYEEIQNLALVIHGAPKPMVPAADIDDHLVQMPARARLRPSLAKVARDQAAKLQEPPSNCFVRSIDATFGEHFLDVAERQGKAGVEPDGVDDHRRRKAMALERYWLHHPNLTPEPPSRG